MRGDLLAFALALSLAAASGDAQQPSRPAGAQPAPQAAAPAPAPAPAAGAPRTQAATPAAHASAPVYNIEMIVFRANTALGSPEDWAAEVGAGAAAASDAEGAAAAPTGAAGGVAGSAAEASTAAAGAATATAGGGPLLRVLDRAEFQLDDLEARLRASGAYSPVAHVAWSQTASPWGSPVGIPVQRLGIDAAGLSGSVALERGQFLHIALMLNYAMANPPAGLGAAPGTVFSVNQNHRVRFYERNYFDHPAFGVIAMVRPAGGTHAGR
ncbi:MAG TPA: CsiV family protein [Steroidobacteraceae bacterium]|nr:CsiV family protein [Steroidobacteraceae bacterium]